MKLYIYIFITIYLLFPQSGGERGALDTWPVYSLSPAVSSQLRSINKRTEELSHDLNPSLSTKPKFLQQLEAFLEKEIRLLGCPLKGPNVLRLQVMYYCYVDNYMYMWIYTGS